MFWLSNPSVDIIEANFERSATLEPFKGKAPGYVKTKFERVIVVGLRSIHWNFTSVQ